MFLSSSLLLLLTSSSSALPSYQEDRSLEASSSSCPFHQTGAKLKEALSQAAVRREAWEAVYPSTTFERKYTPGLKSNGEVFCEGNEDQKFCNKIHGPWGDAIPQDEGVYCLWAILEFQDPPEFNYGEDNANSTSFNGIFEATVSSLNGVPEGGFLTNVATGGQVGSQDPDAIPWPVASIIWKSGNKYAKPWIEDIHRPNAQLPGYNFGFIFHGHFKAVKCDTILPVFEANGFELNSDGNFRKYWNAFSDVVDLSDQFVKDKCVSACKVGPCLEPTEKSAADGRVSLLYPAFFSSLGLALLVSGIAGLLL